MLSRRVYSPSNYCGSRHGVEGISKDNIFLFIMDGADLSTPNYDILKKLSLVLLILSI